MPLATHCSTHPQAIATGRCRKCGKHVCDGCKLITGGGTFCSIECAESHSEFQAYVSVGVPRGRSRFNWRGFFAKIGVLALHLALFYGVMFVLYGLTDPEAMVRKVGENISKAWKVTF